MEKSLVILAFHFNNANNEYESKKENLSKIISRFTTSGVDLNIFVFPTEYDDRVECIYPKYVVNEELSKQFETSLKKINEIVANIKSE